MKRYVLRYWMLIWLFALLGGVPLVGQGSYGKLMEDESGIIRNLNIDDIVYHDDHLYVRGNKWIDSIGIWGLFVAQLDTNGTILWQNTIYDTTLQSSYSVNTPTRFSITEDELIILPNYFFHLNRLALTVLDSSGNEIFTEKYPHVGITIYPGEVIKRDNYYYLFGRVQRDDYAGDCYVVKADREGNMIWLKYYGLHDLSEGFGGVVLNTDGTFTISSYRASKELYASGPQIIGWKAPWIFTIDTSGMIVEEWLGEQNDTITLGEGTLRKFPNGDWVVFSRDFEVFPTFEGYRIWVSPTITRLDSNFELVWKKNLLGFENNYTFFRDMEYDSIRDEIVVCGHRKFFYSEGFANWEIWMVKMNGDGDILWDITDTIIYNSTDGHVEAGLEIAPSGSIYVAGYVAHLGDRHGWIIKITPDGCTDTLCTTTSIEEQIRNWVRNVVLYPNPATDVLNIRIKELPDSADLVISDMHGREWRRQPVQEGDNVVNLNLPSGMYVCTVFSSGGLVYSGKVVVR